MFTAHSLRYLLLGLVLFCTIGQLGVSSGVGGIGDGIEVVSADPLAAREAAARAATVAEKAGGGGGAAVAEATNVLVTIINELISLLSYVLAPLVMLAGWLLSPDWTFGDIFGLRPVLKQLWILISNVVYVIFAFILVFVAFANIF